MNRSYPYFPSFSIIFHDFPWFSIIFHRSTHGQNLVSMFLLVPGDGHPSDPSDPGMQRQEPSPKVMQVLQVRPAAPLLGPQMIDPSTHWDFLGLTKSMTFLWHDEFCVWAMGYLGSFFWCTGSAGRLGDSPLTDYRCFCMLVPSRAPLIGDFLLPCLMSEG